jgi:hypothetical protein
MKLQIILLAILANLSNIALADTSQTYHLEVLDYNGQVMQTTDFDYPNPKSEKTLTQNSFYLNLPMTTRKLEQNVEFVNLCLKNKDKVINSYQNTSMTMMLDATKPFYTDRIFTVVADIPYLQPVNIGDCNIQTPVNQHLTILTVLPFSSYYQKFPIMDSFNQPTDKSYTIKIIAK